MVLAIDSTGLARLLVSRLDTFVGPRYHAYRACYHATVMNDSSLRKRLDSARGVDLATREALEWQADQDDDLDEAEVIHHLHQQAKSSPLFENAISRTERSNVITTLVTSCSLQSQSLLAVAQGKPLSSFRRLSFRQCMKARHDGFAYSPQTNLDKILPKSPPLLPFRWVRWAPDIIGASLSETEDCVVWHLQIDLVDLLSPRRLSTWRPGKRRRTINPFHQVPAPPEHDVSPGNHPPEAKRFKGVRHRRDRKTWAAEMKPPKSKDKVSFGEFKSQAQAARAIDSAFHYYGKPHLLNFPDTPRILSTRSSPAGVLNEKDQLRFVKEQVKWLASMASTLPAPPSSVPSAIPESSRGSVQITVESLGWDGAGDPALMNLINSTEPSCESQGSWMNYLAMSPPASMLPLPPRSPISFHGDVTHGLLEKESFNHNGRGEGLRG